jgi:transcription initiation factor TFIID subunit 8
MTKRARFESPSPSIALEDEFELPVVATTEFFDDSPRLLLMRSAVLILEHVGFSSASPEAVEALCNEAESCQYIDWFPVQSC